MKQNYFKKSQLAAAIALVTGAGLLNTVHAQEAASTEQAQDAEVIEVRGIRGSLIRSQDLKRESSGVVDAISAEELGKFPDTNLAESLQRITGVTISRANNEGSQITVRGFGPEFNLVTLNGRQMPGTGYTRSFNFENLSSEGVSTLELQKTARAENPSGGLGATVNIITSRPLQKSGQQYSFSAKGIYDTSNETGDDVTPEFAGVYSNTFADDTFGVGISFSHQERDFRQESANIQGWKLQSNASLPDLDPSMAIDNRSKITDAAFFPQDMNYGFTDVQRERTNAQVTLQYRPMENVTATLDYVTTDATTGSDGFGWGIWNGFGNNISSYELDENGTAIFMETVGNDGSFTANRSTTEVKARSVGLNIDWTINDDWKVAVDYHDSSNEADNGKDKGIHSAGQVILGSDKLISKSYDFRTGEVPHFMIDWQNGTNELMASEIDSNFGQFLRQPGRAEIQQLQVDSEWFNSSFEIPLISVKFGVAHTKQTLDGIDGWSGIRGGIGFAPSFTQIFPDGMFERQDIGDFLDAFEGGGSDLQPGYYYTFSFDEAIARQLYFLNEDVMGDAVFSIDPFFERQGISSVEEATSAIYVQSEWEVTVADKLVQINAGLRYEQTDVTSAAVGEVPLLVKWASASEWLTVFKDEKQSVYNEGDYDILLPMLDIKVDLTDDVVGRFSWGKSITRAPIGSLASNRSFSGSPKIGARTVGDGNPGLLPYESTNLDLSLEWYYDDASYAAIGLFRKSVKNYISSEVVELQFEGLYDVYQGQLWNMASDALEADGIQASDSAIYDYLIANGYGDESGAILPTSSDPLITWQVSRPANLKDTKVVKGVELAVQHTFGDTGFGVGANATLVQGDVEHDPYNLERQDPLVGIGDSANFQAFYEKDGLSVKVTYAWRDDYVIGMGQSQGSAEAPATQFADFGQWDMSVNYDVDENLTVFFEGVNINNETERGYGRFEEQFLFARQYGPRYVLGARYTFH